MIALDHLILSKSYISDTCGLDFCKVSCDSPTMSAPKEDKSNMSSPNPGSAGLHIPEAKDGFFGYTEEKSLQQVFGIIICF